MADKASLPKAGDKLTHAFHGEVVVIDPPKDQPDVPQGKVWVRTQDKQPVLVSLNLIAQ